MATAQNLTMIYLARILCGIGAGLSTLSVVYVSEISDPHIRPALLCLNSVYVSLGILLTSALGMFFEWRFIAVMFVGITLASSLLLLFIPESPHWLITFRPKEELSLIRSMKWIYRREPVSISPYRSYLTQLQRDKRFEFKTNISDLRVNIFHCTNSCSTHASINLFY